MILNYLLHVIQNLLLVIQSSPLIWSTDVRSTRLYGHFLAGPNHPTRILNINPDIRSARLYGQFSLDKTLTLQAGSTVQTKQQFTSRFCPSVQCIKYFLYTDTPPNESKVHSTVCTATYSNCMMQK